MDFHKDLITKIKLKDKQSIYDILDYCLVKDLENSKLDDFKKYHADLLLSFIADEKDPTILKPYLRLLLKLYENNQWKLDLSTYSLIIRILCYLEKYDEALSYLTRIDSLHIKITNRIIAPFFEKLSTDFLKENFKIPKTLQSINLEMKSLLILINLFEKYNHIFLQNEYYYLLMKFNSFLKHFHKNKLENDKNQNQIQNQIQIKLTQELLSINETIFKTFDKILKIWCNIDFVLSINFIENFQYLNKEIKEIKEIKENQLNQENLKEIVLSNENQCSICENYLKKHSLTDEERQLLIEQLLKVYNKEYNIGNNLENNLIKFLNLVSRMVENTDEDYITYIIDGGNIGYSKNGNFNAELIKSFINMIHLEHKKLKNELKNYNILLVLHQNKKQYFNKIKKEKENDTEIKEKKDNCIIYYTPYNEYDDYYWLLASFMIENSLTITNDKLKDHHVNKLDETLFNRWKNSHLTSYSRNASSDNLLDSKSISSFNYNFQLNKPLTYTKGTQKILGDDKNIYHFPVQNNEELKWFCYHKR